MNYDGDNHDIIPQPGWVDCPSTTSSLDNRTLKLTRMTQKKCENMRKCVETNKRMWKIFDNKALKISAIKFNAENGAKIALHLVSLGRPARYQSKNCKNCTQKKISMNLVGIRHPAGYQSQVLCDACSHPDPVHSHLIVREMYFDSFSIFGSWNWSNVPGQVH